MINPDEVRREIAAAVRAGGVAFEVWLGQEENRSMLDRVTDADHDALVVHAAIAHLFGTGMVAFTDADADEYAPSIPEPYAEDLQRALREAVDRLANFNARLAQQRAHTAASIIAAARRDLQVTYAKLGDAADWVRVADVPVTADQRDQIRTILRKVDEAKAAINEAM